MDEPGRIAINGVDYPVLGYDQIEQSRDLVVRIEPGGDIDWRDGVGPGYLYSDGWDATKQELRLAPTPVYKEVKEFTTKHGWGFEVPIPWSGIVVVGNKGTMTEVAGGGSVTYTNWTVPAGDDRCLIFAVASASLSAGDFDAVADYPTFNGIRMDFREAGPSTGGISYLLFYQFLGSGDAITGDIVYPNPGNDNVACGWINLTNVYQRDVFGNPHEAVGTATPATTGAWSDDYSLALTVLAIAPTTVTAGSGTKEVDVTSGTVQLVIGTKLGSGAGEQQMSFTGAPKDWAIAGLGILGSSFQNYCYLYDDEYIHKFQFTGTPRLLGTISELNTPYHVANGELGARPAYWNGAWKVPCGASADILSLDLVVSGSGADTWTPVQQGGSGLRAVELCVLQDSATPELVATYYGNPNATANVIATAPEGGMTFTVWGTVGPNWQQNNSAIDVGGALYIGGSAGLLAIDVRQIARPVIELLPRGNVERENGKGTSLRGDIIFYPRSDGLWAHFINRENINIAPSQIPELVRLPNSGAPHIHDRRPWSPIVAGEWVYYSWSDFNEEGGAVMAVRVRKSGDRVSSRFVTHMLWDRYGFKGGFLDSQSNLWMKNGNIAGTYRGVEVMSLAASGSPDTLTRRGKASTVHTFQLPPIVPVKQRTTQLVAWEITTANVWTNSTLRLKMFRDSAASATEVGPSATPITAAGVYQKAPETWGTNDTAEQWVPQLELTTAAGYNPITEDPWVLRQKLVFRTPQRYRALIPMDDTDLSGLGLDAFTARQLLERGLHKLVTVDPPTTHEGSGLYGTPYTSEIDSVQETEQQGKRVLAVTLLRWVQD